MDTPEVKAKNPRKTKEQIKAGLEQRLQRIKFREKKEERATTTRRLIVAAAAIEAMAKAGDDDAKRAWDKMLAGLKRPQDREVFGLPPLPVPVESESKPVQAQPHQGHDDDYRRDRLPSTGNQ
jgi:hypothetical protein